MKPSKDDKVIAELKRQIKAEKEYNKPFLKARSVVKEREQTRETEYQKFKRHQSDQYQAEENLRNFLSKKT